jgi:hypothetical protein
VIDVLDPTMKDAESVATAFSFPVLAVIPYVKPRDQARLAKLPLDAPPGTGAASGRRRRRLSFRRSEGRGTSSRAR